MAITYVGTGTTVYSTGNPSPGAAANAIGDLLILVVGTKPDSTPATTPSGWTLLGSASGGTGSQGIDTGPMRVGVFYKVATSANEAPGAITVTGNNISAASVYAFRPGAGNILDIAGTGAADTTTGTPHSAVMPVNPGLTVGDALLAVGVIPTDVTTPAQFSAQTVSATGMTTVSLTEIEEWDTSSGQDMGGWVARGSVVTGTATAAPTVSATAGGTTTNVAGPIFLVRMRELPAQESKSGSDSGTISVTEGISVAPITSKSGSDTGTISATESINVVPYSAPSEPTVIWSGTSSTLLDTTNFISTGATNAAIDDFVVVYATANTDVQAGWTSAGFSSNVTQLGASGTGPTRYFYGKVTSAGQVTATPVIEQSEYNLVSMYVIRGVDLDVAPKFNGNILAEVDFFSYGASTQWGNAIELVFSLDSNGAQAIESTIGVETSVTVGQALSSAAYSTSYFTSRGSSSGTNYQVFLEDYGIGITILSGLEIKGAGGDGATPKTASDSGTFSVTDSATTSVNASRPDTGTLSVTDSLSIASSLSRTDTGTLSVTDSASVVATLSLSDTGTISVTDSVSIQISAALGLSETGTLSGADSMTIASALARTDMGTLSSNDALSLASSSNRSDTGTISVTDTMSILVSVSLGDTGTVSGTDSSAPSVNQSLNDAGTISGTDNMTKFAAIALADSGTISGTDLMTLFRSYFLTDGGTVSATDTLTSAGTMSLADSGTLSVTEAAVVTMPYSDVSRSDTATVSATDNMSLNVTISPADSGTISATDTMTLFKAMAINDAGTVSGTDNLGFNKNINGSDAGTISVTDTATVFVFNTLSTTDSGSVSATESVSVSGTTNANDSGTITATDSVSLFKMIALVDSGTISATDTLNTFSDRPGIDSGIISVTDSASVAISGLVTKSANDSGALSGLDVLGSGVTLSRTDTASVSATETASSTGTTGTADAGTLSGTEEFNYDIEDNSSDTATVSITEGISIVIIEGLALDVWDGTQFKTGIFHYWDGTQFVHPPVRAWNGTSFVTL